MSLLGAGAGDKNKNLYPATSRVHICWAKGFLWSISLSKAVLHVCPYQCMIYEGLQHLKAFDFDLEGDMPGLFTTTFQCHVRKGVFEGLCVCLPTVV